jgi:hypothetical protein
MCILSEFIYHNQYAVSIRRAKKSFDKIHRYCFPSFGRHTQRLQFARVT